MARRSSRHPTELELEILKILWRDGPASTRHVRQALADFRDLAYTSVMTIMNIMLKKGYLSRAKQAGVYVYQVQITEAAARRGMLGDLVDRVFNGSAAVAALNLLQTADLDTEQLKQLRELINFRIREESS